MIPADRLVLLDTNVLLHVIRGRAPGRWILDSYALSARPERPLVSSVSLGELWRIAFRAGWGEARLERLHLLGTQLVVVGLERDVVRSYGELGATLDERGRPIPQNDVWIAATAAAKRAVLLTTDAHFGHLEGTALEHEFVDPALLPR